MRFLLGLIGVLLLTACGRQAASSESSAPADPVALGAQKARVCMGCHGPGGVSRVASYPSLAGREAEYLLEQLRAFKEGERENPMMSSMVTSLSDEDMAHLAAYFAAQTMPEANE